MVESFFHFLYWLILGSILPICTLLLCGGSKKQSKEKPKTDRPVASSAAKTEKTNKPAMSKKTKRETKPKTAAANCDLTQKSVEQPVSAVKKTQQTQGSAEAAELHRTQEGSKEKDVPQKAVVNEYVRRAAADGNILDPKNVQNMGNIDDIEKESHENRVKDLENIKSEPDQQSISKQDPVDPNKRVSINETNCKLYETNDVATMEDGSENQEGEV